MDPQKAKTEQIGMSNMSAVHVHYLYVSGLLVLSFLITSHTIYLLFDFELLLLPLLPICVAMTS